MIKIYIYHQLSFYLFLLLIHYCHSQSEKVFDQRTVLTTTNWDFYMFVDSMDQGISKIIRRQGQHNGHIIQLLLHYFNKDQAFIHIGTHIGLQTLVIGRQMKKYNGMSKVYAFQPQFFSYTLLSKSIVFNDLQQYIDIFHAGIAAQNGKGQIAVQLTDTNKKKGRQQADCQFNNYQLSNTSRIVDRSSIDYRQQNSLLIYLQLSKDLIIISDWKYGINPHKDINTIINIINKLQNLEYKIYQIIGKQKNSLDFNELKGFNSLANIQNSKLLLLPPSKQIPK